MGTKGLSQLKMLKVNLGYLLLCITETACLIFFMGKCDPKCSPSDQTRASLSLTNKIFHLLFHPCPCVAHSNCRHQCFWTFDMAPHSSDAVRGRQFFPLLSPFSFPLLTLTFLGNLMPNLATKGVREEGRIAAMGRRQAAAAKNNQRSV